MGNEDATRQSIIVMIYTGPINQPERVPTGVSSIKPIIKFRLSMQQRLYNLITI